jgi:raffinose/stachyose/melibiose transport system substrate-binding protein
LADKVNKQDGQSVDRRIYTPELYDAVAVAVQGIFSGDVTPEEAMQQVQADSEKIYGAAAEAPAAEEEPVTLTFFTQEPGAYPTINTEVQKSFEAKYPNVTIDKKVVGYGEFQSTLAALIASGDPPDIIMAEPGGPYIALVEGGALEDLTPYLEADGGTWENQMHPNALDLMRADGKVYAIPVSLNNMQVMVNQGLLEEKGLKQPETIDDVIEMAGALEGSGITPFTFGIADKWSGVDLFVALVWQQGGGDLLHQADKGEASWTDPTFVKAMEAIKSMVDAGAVFEGATAMAWHEDALPTWMQGNSIMVWPGGNFMIQDIPPEMEVDAIWFPALPGGEQVLTGGVALALGVSSQSEHKDIAAEFLKEFTTQDAFGIIFENGVSPGGPLETDVESAYPLADKVNKQDGQSVDRRIYTPELYDAVAVAVQGIFSGDVTPEEAMQEVQATSDKVYEK